MQVISLGGPDSERIVKMFIRHTIGVSERTAIHPLVI